MHKNKLDKDKYTKAGKACVWVKTKHAMKKQSEEDAFVKLKAPFVLNHQIFMGWTINVSLKHRQNIYLLE